MKVRKFKIKIRNSTDDAELFEDFKKDFVKTWKAAEKGLLKNDEYELELAFPDVTYLSKIFRPERIRMIQMIKEKKPDSIYQLAKLLGRTTANVQRDVSELAELGIIELKKAKKKGQKREVVTPEYNWDGFDIAV
jgi:predicted transcriptional regulator